MPSTDQAAGINTTRFQGQWRVLAPGTTALSAYALDTKCIVLTKRMVLPGPYRTMRTQISACWY
eukprot:494884-Rhodomonas_salina.1